MYKISAIIPIYNAEDYLEDAINSIVNQTFGFKNIELILVDDCSNDNSSDMVMLLHYAQTKIPAFPASHVILELTIQLHLT